MRDEMTMETPVVAVIGSVREEIVTDSELRATARDACRALGVELARQGCRIAVYDSDPDFIEADFVSGYVGSGKAQPSSITCYSLGDVKNKFPEQDQRRELFALEPARDDWEITFFRSLANMDGVVLVGGGSSTLSAAHVVLSGAERVPIVALKRFGGSAKKVWDFLRDSDAADTEAIKTLATWDEDTAQQSVAYLVRRHEERLGERAARSSKHEDLQRKADLWDARLASQPRRKRQSLAAAGAFLVFVAVLIMGLTWSAAGGPFIALFISGLATAGAAGATVRMLRPDAPDSPQLATVILGLAAGLVLSLFYLLPQLIGDAGFLQSDPNEWDSNSVRVQYLSATLVAFVAGLGFDYVMDRLRRAGQKRADDVLNSTQ